MNLPDHLTANAALVGIELVRRTKLTWTPERPTHAGWYWVRWPKQPQYGPEIVLIDAPNGPDTDYLEIHDVPLHEYIDAEGGVEWQGPLEPEGGAAG